MTVGTESAIVSPPRQRDSERKTAAQPTGMRSSSGAETIRNYVNNTTMQNAKLIFTTRVRYPL